MQRLAQATSKLARRGFHSTRATKSADYEHREHMVRSLALQPASEPQATSSSAMDPGCVRRRRWTSRPPLSAVDLLHPCLAAAAV